MSPQAEAAAGRRYRSLVIRAWAGAIAVLAAIAALLLAALAAAGAPALLSLWIASEGAFVWSWCQRRRRLEAQPAVCRPAALDSPGLLARFRRAQRHFRLGSESYLRGWFRGPDVSKIRKGDVRELISWGFFYCSSSELASHEPLVDAFISEAEKHADVQLQDGHSPGLPFMRHLEEPLPAQYRPLIFYTVTELIAFCTRAALLAAGFSRQVDDGSGIVYYTLPAMPRQSKAVAWQSNGQQSKGQSEAAWPWESQSSDDSSDSGSWADGATSSAGDEGTAFDSDISSSGAAEASLGPLPVLVAHGVAAGLAPYMGVVLWLAATGRPIIAPEIAHISMRLVPRIPSIDEIADSTATFLAERGIGRVHVLGHSFGTLVASRLYQQRPSLVASLGLLDPVCFGMFEPHLLRGFLYKTFFESTHILEAGMYLVSRELHMCSTFCRGFFWSDLNLWADQLPKHTLVVLSGRDCLLSMPAVRDSLIAESEAKLIVNEEMHHAEILGRPTQLTFAMNEWAAMAAAAEQAGCSGGCAAPPAAAGASSGTACWEPAGGAEAAAGFASAAAVASGGACDQGDDDETTVTAVIATASAVQKAVRAANAKAAAVAPTVSVAPVSAARTASMRLIRRAARRAAIAVHP